MKTTHALAPGVLLGRYQLVERLGVGGMGEVWRAADSVLRRDVAVKVLRPETVATPERLKRFETEARTAATVSHPNLVHVYDVGDLDGKPYIVQELVAGRTLAQVLEKEGPVPAERAAEWTAQAADGLAAAHAVGILHRDVKPGNLIVGADGRVRVLDFGLAKLLGGEGRNLGVESVTGDGLVVGTVHYMSPEQALGRDLTTRSDAFSLGTVLYELVTGKRPFESDSTVGTMHAIAYGTPRPIGSGDPPVPPGLVAILEKALEKAPADRYASLSDMAVDLRRFVRRSSAASLSLDGLVSPSAPTQVVPGARGTRLLRPALVAGGVIALAALTLGVVRLVHPGLPKAHDPAATRLLVQSQSCEEAPVFSPDGRGFAFSSNAGGNYDVFYRLISGGEAVRLTESEEDEREPWFSPDGGTIYFARGDIFGPRCSIWAVPTLGGPARRILEAGDTPSISRDGKLLAFRRWVGRSRALWVSDPDGGHARELFEPRTGRVAGPCVSPDGGSVAFLWQEGSAGDLGDVWVVPVAGGAPVRLSHDRKGLSGRVSWLPDGSAVLFAVTKNGSENIWMVARGGGQPRAVTTGSGWLVSPCLSPDGRSLLAQSEKWLSDAWEYALPEGKARPLTTGGGVWAPIRVKGGRLVYGDWSRQEEEIDLYVQEPSGARTLLAEGSNPRVSASGETLYFSTASGGGHRCLASVEIQGGPPHRLTNPVGVDEYPDPTPDGRSLLFCRSFEDGRSFLMLLSLARPGALPRTLFSGPVSNSRAGADTAVFRACAAPQQCGVYAVPYGGGPPRLLVPGGRWPAFSSDGRSVYAITGALQSPSLFRAPLDASAPPLRLFDFNAPRDPQFWAVFTLDVTPGDASVVVTHQKKDSDIVLLEGVFR